MSKLLAVAVAALALAACGKGPEPSPAAPAATSSEPAAGSDSAATGALPAAPAAPATGTPVGETTPEDATPPSDATLERMAQLPPQDQLPAGRWQVGRNYKPIVPAQPTNVAPGQVEVIEMFWYGCGACYQLDPFLESWKKNKPAYVQFVRIPVTWSAAHRSHARLFYALQALGTGDALHVKIFDTIHRGGNLLVGNDDESSFRAQLAFVRANGIDEKAFTDAYRSFGVESALQRADQLMRRYRVDGVPMIVINGKYSTGVAEAGGHSQLLALINDLAAAEKRR